MRRYSKSDFKVMPWKNGQGVTTEIFRLDDKNCPEEFLLRLSRAEVRSSGPFSQFPSIDRQLLLLKGQGFTLTSPTFKKTMNRAFEIFSFQGEESIQCELLEGPCVDFNVMVKRNWKKASTRVFQPMIAEEILADSLSLIYDVDQEILWELSRNDSLCLSPGIYIVIQLND